MTHFLNNFFFLSFKKNVSIKINAENSSMTVALYICAGAAENAQKRDAKRQYYSFKIGKHTNIYDDQAIRHRKERV